jgi:hypothetical protein
MLNFYSALTGVAEGRMDYGIRFFESMKEDAEA